MFSKNIVTSPINGEDTILWFDPVTRLQVEDPPNLPWIRESVVYAPSRKGPIKVGKYAQLFGYSTIGRKCQTRGISVGIFIRRMFWRNVTDATIDFIPRAAVKPETIRPGVPGEPMEGRSTYEN